MKNLIGLLLISLFTVSISCNRAPVELVPEDYGLSSDTLALAEEYMQSFIDSAMYAGILVRTFKDGEVVHFKKFGYSDLESKTPIKEDDIFRVFSMTKPVTAAALMTLYEEGKFELDDPVYKFIPSFENTKVYTPSDEGFTLEEQESPITIRHLLTHTSGLSYGFVPSQYVDSLYNANGLPFVEKSLEETVESLASLPLVFQPGTAYNYSMSIDVAGYIIELLSGQSLDVFMEERIFDPLKMDDSGFYVPEDKHDRLVTMYTRDGGIDIIPYDKQTGGSFGESFKKEPVFLAGGAGMVSTISDYERFARMLLNGGELDGVRVLKEATVDMIMSDQLPEGVKYGGENMGYGLGGFVNRENGRYGWSGAASTTFTVFPEDNMIVTCFSQVFWSDNTYANYYRYYVTQALIEE